MRGLRDHGISPSAVGPASCMRVRLHDGGLVGVGIGAYINLEPWRGETQPETRTGLDVYVTLKSELARISFLRDV
jgi:hypothetical protein